MRSNLRYYWVIFWTPVALNPNDPNVAASGALERPLTLSRQPLLGRGSRRWLRKSQQPVSWRNKVTIGTIFALKRVDVVFFRSISFFAKQIITPDRFCISDLSRLFSAIAAAPSVSLPSDVSSDGRLAAEWWARTTCKRSLRAPGASPGIPSKISRPDSSCARYANKPQPICPRASRDSASFLQYTFHAIVLFYRKATGEVSLLQITSRNCATKYIRKRFIAY